MKLYIKDTIPNPPRYLYFDNVDQLLKASEIIFTEATKQTRREYMILMESLGHGPDDRQGKNFLRLFSERFETGVLKNGKHFRCDVYAVDVFSKPEFGD